MGKRVSWLQFPDGVKKLSAFFLVNKDFIVNDRVFVFCREEKFVVLKEKGLLLTSQVVNLVSSISPVIFESVIFSLCRVPDER